MTGHQTSWSGAPPERWTAFYVRVTKEESVKTDLSIPNQIARAKEIAASHGWSAFRIYVEPRNVSGECWLERRPALKDIVDDIFAGRIERLCARHTDRLWRGAEIQTKLISILHKHAVELWDFSHQLDYKSAHGRFSLQVLGAASELEVKLTAERIREMKRGKALKGKVGGGPPPFGYTSQSRRCLELQAAGYSADEAYRKACLDLPVGKCWSVDEKEGKIVRLIFKLYTAPQFRLGSKRIASYLNENGYRTRNGLAWLSNYVRRIINNPAYAGFTTYDEKAYEQRLPSQRPRFRQALYKGEHDALIPEELWRKAQEIKISENSIRRVRVGAKERREFSLTGIIRCPSCNSRMVGKWSANTERTYYICARRHNGGTGLCSFPLIDARALQRETWKWVHELITSPEFVLEHLARLTKKLEAERPSTEKHSVALSRRQEEIKGALAKYYTVFESSQDATRDSALLDRIKELRSELQAIEVGLAEMKAKIVPLPRRLTVERVKAHLQKLQAMVDERPEYQRQLFQELKRHQGFKVQPLSKEEVVLSVALPVQELVAPRAEAVAGTVPSAGANGGMVGARVGERRVFTVISGTPGAERAANPEAPAQTEPRLLLEHRVHLASDVFSGAEWAATENAIGHHCACGCGQRITVLPQHHSKGIPKYLRAHHPMAMTREMFELRAEGLMTASDAAKRLGISATSLLRLEGVAFKAVPRWGKRKIRVFTEKRVEAIARWLARAGGRKACRGLMKE